MATWKLSTSMRIPILRSRRKPNVRSAGTEQDIEESVGDYKEVGGIIFPFAMESGIKGSQQKEKLTITKIELNLPAEDSIFKMPAAAPAPAPAKPDTTKELNPRDGHLARRVIRRPGGDARLSIDYFRFISREHV
jgi:hypothetical protein